MDIYICPICSQENGEHQKYCLNCGKWLLDPNFPPIKKGSQKRKNRTGIGFVPIILLAVIGAYWYMANGGTIRLPSDKVIVREYENEQFRFSQMEITRGVKTSIPLDLTVRRTSTEPLEIVAVFYDEAGNRIARASTVITYQMPAGYETTLLLQLDEPANLISTRNVRLEVTPLDTLRLLERTLDSYSKLSGK